MTDYYCERCEKRTSMMGHLTTHCRMTNTTRELHQCCPENCELEESGS